MPALLCPIIEISAALFVEENDQLARCQTVLRSAEAKDFYAGSPGDFFRRSSKCRDRVRGRPIGDEKNVAIDFKKFTDAITQALSPLIITVSCRCAGIRVLKRSARFRAKARGIVARELLAPLNHSACRYPSFPIRAIE